MPLSSAFRRLALTGLCTAMLARPALAQDLGGANAAASNTVQALQQRLLSDPEMAASIQALRDDPKVQAILADAAIAAALARGDMAALLSDPKVRELADDPLVQDLARQVAH